MAKSAKQIQGDFIDLLQGTELMEAVTGEVYRNGYRPLNSELEDIIVTHTSGTTNQKQTGVVTVNIYVKDTLYYDGSETRLAENGERVSELEAIALKWALGLEFNSDTYYVSLQETINTVKVENIDQHAIVVKLKYEFFNI